MKKYMPVFAVAFCALVSCDLLGDGMAAAKQEEKGTITLKFGGLSKGANPGETQCFPDTNSFILSVMSESGEELYRGSYGKSPDRISVSPGRYFVDAFSFEFNEPRFDCPQWGDSQTVEVQAGQNLLVEMLCRQMNSGIRLLTDDGFREAWPGGHFVLLSEDGFLNYAFTDTRLAFFKSGLVQLLLRTDAGEESLLKRNMAEGEILSLYLKMQARQDADAGIRVAVDTSRTYVEEAYVYGDEFSSNNGESPETAFSVAQAREHVGEKAVWVGAYVVGGDLTSKSVSFSPPFSSASNMAVGPRAQTLSRDNCLSVQLPSGTVRDALNLVTNPGMLGTYVYIRGDIVSSYFGLVGLKNLTEFRIVPTDDSKVKNACNPYIP